MANYARMYRLRMTPWEKYGPAAAASIAAVLDREENERCRPLGRALDLGCGRGQFTPELARRGWQAVGIDYVPAAIEAASSRCTEDVTYVVGDITNLAAADLGYFEFFLDIGCFQGLDADQRRAAGETVSALAGPGATILMLALARAGTGSSWAGCPRAKWRLHSPAGRCSPSSPRTPPGLAGP